MPGPVSRYAGRIRLPPGSGLSTVIFDGALAEWLRRCSLVQLKRWDVRGRKGNARMIYAGVLFKRA